MLARSDPAGEPLLERILSIVADSFDGVEVFRDEGVRVVDFAAQRNRLIDIGERRGYAWMFMLDSDECMFPKDIAKVRSLMTPRNSLIVLPRYEFVKDFDHYDPQGYPDYQGRVFRLGMGYRFRRRVHEGLYRRFAVQSEMRHRRGAFSDTTPNYHYGRLKSTEEMLLKLYNYELIREGKAPAGVLPPGTNVDDGSWLWGRITRFEAPHPLRDL